MNNIVQTLDIARVRKHKIHTYFFDNFEISRVYIITQVTHMVLYYNFIK